MFFNIKMKELLRLLKSSLNLCPSSNNPMSSIFWARCKRTNKHISYKSSQYIYRHFISPLSYNALLYWNYYIKTSCYEIY